MTAPKFTAGPWVRDQWGNLLDPTGERVTFNGVSVYCAGAGLAEADANTDLAGAAPALFAAINYLLSCSVPMSGQQEQCWISLRAAIAKALGEAP